MLKAILTRLLDALRSMRPPRPQQTLENLDELAVYLDEQAAYIAQSAAYSYCRARTGFMGPKLFEEPSFLARLEITKWETYLAVLEDLFLILESHIRPAEFAGQERLHATLCVLYDRILTGRPVPDHLEQGWPKAGEGFSLRLAQSQMTAEKSPATVSQHSGKVLFETVPIHPDLKNLDEEMVINSIRFRFVRFAEDLKKKLAASPQFVNMALAEAP